MSVSSVDLEMQSPTHSFPTPTSSDEEEGRQCWRDVEAETGFSSYSAFLEALPETGPRFSDLRAHLKYPAPRYLSGHYGEVHVHDILENGGVSFSMKVQIAGEFTPMDRDLNSDNNRKSCTQLLRSLRSPLGKTPARIVVWSSDPVSEGLHPGLVDAIGLGLKIQPAMFATLLAIVKERGAPHLSRRTASDYVVIGNSVATVARNYRSNERVPPVLLVARVHERGISFERASRKLQVYYDDIVEEALKSEIYGSVSLCYPAGDMRPLKDLAPKLYGYLNRLSNHVYLNLLSK